MALTKIDGSMVEGVVKNKGNQMITGTLQLNGDTIDLRNSGRRHITFTRPDGSADGYIYCDAGQDNLCLNRGSRGGGQLDIHNDAIIGAVTGRPSYQGGIFRTGTEGGVNGSGWADWHLRNAAFAMDVPAGIGYSAYSILKATQWGTGHLFCMDMHRPSTTSMQVRILVGDANTGSFSFYQDGHGASSRGWTVTSDANLKEDIAPIAKARESILEKCSKFSGKRYLRKNRPEGEGAQLGFLAQEVQVEFPELVETHVDTTTEEKTETLAMNYGAMTAVHHDAINELYEEVKRLRAELEELKRV